MDIVGSDGRYDISSLPAGNWDLRANPPVTQPNLVPIVFPDVTLGAGQNRTVDFDFGGPVGPPPDTTMLPNRGGTVPIII